MLRAFDFERACYAVGCRGPSTSPSQSLRSWLGFAQDDKGGGIGVAVAVGMHGLEC